MAPKTDFVRRPGSTAGTPKSVTDAGDLAKFESDPLVDAFARHLATRAAHTRKAYVRDVAELARVAGVAALPSLTRSQLARCLATLHGRGRSGRSLARMLSAWRAFFRFLIEEKRVNDDPTAGLKAPKSARRLPDALTPEEAGRLVAIEPHDTLALRDRALLELAYSSGLRVSEIASLNVGALDLVQGEVRVLGKGSKERIVPVGAKAREAVETWLRERASIAADGEHALFVGRRGMRLTTRAIERRLEDWALKQGLSRHVHPHMLRHSFASHVLQSSGDLRAVQEMLGHASIASTQVYTHLDFQALAKVYDAAHPRAKRAKVSVRRAKVSRAV
ncbi:MAG TPA: tyrosine recombinase XerC [Casimicrobiaceae bacterium]|nr:tyrosine recombinase XerC [Casimicrobiaceae bacterium]